MKTCSAIAGLALALLCGCEDQVKKSPNAIFGKKTQDIGKFDPNEKQEVSDSKVRADDPVLYGLQAYGPMMEQVAKLGVDSHINTFYAVEGRYPKDHDEFMARIIKENNVQLPVLPYGDKYVYDEKNHKLVVIKGQPQKGTPEPAAPSKQ